MQKYLSRVLLLPFILLTYVVGFSQSANYAGWAIRATDLTNGKLFLTAGQTKSIQFSVTVKRIMNATTGQWQPVNFRFQLQRKPPGSGDFSDNKISNIYEITSSDFASTASQVTKTYDLSVTAAGTTTGPSLLSNNDEILLVVQEPQSPTGVWFPTKSYFVTFDNGGSGGGSTPSCHARVLSEPQSLKITFAEGTKRYFGYAVAAHGKYFVVGAPQENKAYIYRMDECQTKLVQTLSANAGDGSFGFAVDISNDDIVVGAPTGASGALYIFRRNGEAWELSERIEGEPMLAYSVAIHDSHIIVGSPEANGKLGAAHFYEKYNGHWSWFDTTYGSVVDGGFGRSVDIKGNRAIVGAPLNDKSIYFYKLVYAGYLTWQFDIGWHVTEHPGEFGFSVKLSPDEQTAYASGVAGVSNEQYGAILMFALNNGVWQQAGSLHRSRLSEWRFFDVTENHLIVQDLVNYETNLFFYEKTGSGTSWNLIKTIEKWRYDARDRWGEALALSDNYLVVGAPESYCNYPGSVYVYDQFSLYNMNDIGLCNKTYNSNLGELYAKSFAIGCENGPVTYNANASANYMANTITLGLGFHAVAESDFRAAAIGCSLGFTRIMETGRSAGVEDNPMLINPEDVEKELHPNEMTDSEGGDLSCFPNPTNNSRFTVLLRSEAIDKIEVYSMQGILVNHYDLWGQQSFQKEIDMTLHPKGIYVIKVTSKSRKHLKKVSL